MKLSRDRARDYVSDKKRSQHCAICGSSGPLRFCHRPGEDRKFYISQSFDLPVEERTTETIDAEIEKCDLLCGVCQQDETTRKRTQNGTYTPTKPLKQRIGPLPKDLRVGVCPICGYGIFKTQEYRWQPPCCGLAHDKCLPAVSH